MQQYPWLKENGKFLKKDCTDIHVFMHMDDTDGVFKVTDVWGNGETVRVPHKDLKFRSLEVCLQKPSSTINCGGMDHLGSVMLKPHGLHGTFSR